MAIDRNKLWVEAKLDRDRQLLATIRELNLKEIVDRRGQGSISFFNLWAAGKRKVRDLNGIELNSLRRHIKEDRLPKLKLAVGSDPGVINNLNSTYYNGTLHRQLTSFTSKELRTLRGNKKPIVDFKLGVNLNAQESFSWALKLSKLTNTKHKNVLLKAAHGEIYTKAKLFRFGLSMDDVCPRCNETENLRHKLIDCHYVKKIWEKAKPYLEKLSSRIPMNEDTTKIAIAATISSTIGSMTLTAELLQTILQLDPEQTYLVHPKHLVQQAIKRIKIRESNIKIKRGFIDL